MSIENYCTFYENYATIERRISEAAMFGLYHLLEAELTRRNWSLRDLAAEAGVSISTLSNIKNRDITPDLSTLASLSVALKVPLRQIIEACGYDIEGAGSAADEDARITALLRAVPELHSFLEPLSSLNPDDRTAVLTYAEMLVQRRQRTA
jgi:transcriptional regulator with XRE-family HTH domain